jgi:hypothetical protein
MIHRVTRILVGSYISSIGSPDFVIGYFHFCSFRMIAINELNYFLNVAIFWVIAPRSPYLNWSIGGTYHLRLHDKKSADQDTNLQRLLSAFWLYLSSQTGRFIFFWPPECTFLLKPALARSYPLLAFHSFALRARRGRAASQLERLKPLTLTLQTLYSWYPGLLAYSAWRPAARWFLALLIFSLVDRGDTFLLNVDPHADFTALYPRGWRHS